ncbi:lysyl-tRNA synthetase [Segniliparus rotundus DSM 44985]|uniref:Lysine--tRNA ligase n=1 Tax=Segniliparus rotundus (strain ATCC BAA-972 / CDC 1076 / CIP 108378 / DSM 44985 / JCM 13578) TaxID=640132 RepID=D6ZB64_SEGRD|nr:bifunctional lysylphosphatidylglycerol synthetase/lysine--tRNA ligase LysX [Segniliparus rotundus]ADG96823.1 lysyl-tRNA synthetase [Segniliparus rotundus DSM 44985]
MTAGAVEEKKTGARGELRPPRPAAGDKRRRKGPLHLVPHRSGMAIAAFSVLSFLFSVSPHLRRWAETPRVYLDTYFFAVPDTSFAWAFVLGILAAALAERKRLAWLTLLVTLVVFSWYNVVQLLDGERLWPIIGLATHCAAVALLLAAHGEFSTKVRRVAPLRALVALFIGLLVATGLGWALVEAFPHTVPPDERLAYTLNRVVIFTAFERHDFSGYSYGFVNTLLGLFGAFALIAAIIVLFRSQRLASTLTVEEERSIRSLLSLYGEDDSLGYFATRRDKSAVFAPNGKAALTYRVEVGVCLASGDPIGEERSWQGAIGAWLATCESYGWTPAVMGASERGAIAYREAGLSALQLGDEAILNPRSFSLDGPARKVARQAVTRVRRAGITVRVRRHSQLSEEELAATVRRADQWRIGAERGFSMALGRLGDGTDGDCMLVEALGPDGDVVGLLSLVPWGRSGVSLDVMRRDPKSPNGVMDLMICELALHAKQLGVSKISLNFAVFRNAFEEGSRLGAGPMIRWWRGVLLFFSRWTQLEAMYRFNHRFGPEWVPRYVCFEEARVVPRVAMASGIAEGFLVVPKFGGKSEPRGQHPVPPEALLAATALPEEDKQDHPRLPQQVRVRIGKLERLKEQGVNPYPECEPPTSTVRDALAAGRSRSGRQVRVSGRVLRERDHGGVVFVDLSDSSGAAQVVLEERELPDGKLNAFRKEIDLGDLISVEAAPGVSRTGTASLMARDWRLNAKCLRPLPDKRRGLTDPEAKVRLRHVELMTNPQARDALAKRGAVLRTLREQLWGEGFLEVETPVLQRVHGGANAEPFRTHINAYDLPLYLRIAPELYLKRLLVGGMERVFEIGRVFRNEGVDATHNPEFTLLEAYQAHSDYRGMRDLTEQMLRASAQAVGHAGLLAAPGPWPMIPMLTAVSQALGDEVDEHTPAAKLRQHLVERGFECRPDWDSGQLLLELYERLVEHTTTTPTFYSDFPLSVSPLTKQHPDRPGVTQRWDLVVGGMELATAYSELNDPVEQRRRLQAQSEAAASGDPEAMELDEDFLAALEHAMPPSGGLGVGVDRVVMLLTGRTIRETLAFPLVKPK